MWLLSPPQTRASRSPRGPDAVFLKLAAVRHLPSQADLFRFFGEAGNRANSAAYDRFLAPHLDAATRRGARRRKLPRHRRRRPRRRRRRRGGRHRRRPRARARRGGLPHLSLHDGEVAGARSEEGGVVDLEAALEAVVAQADAQADALEANAEAVGDGGSSGGAAR